MTTLTISLGDALARRLEARSAELGKSPEESAREVLSRVAGIPPLRAFARQNAERLRGSEYSSEDEVERAIQEGIEEVRRAR